MYAENCPVAVLETSSSKAPPTLKAGDVTPDIARRFEYACRNYIADKGIKEEDQVRRIINSCFHDNRIIHWIDGNRERLEALTFTAFMKEFRDEWLEHEWARKLDSKLRVMRQKNRTFREWYNDFYSQVLLLTGTSEEKSDEEIRRLVYSLMDEHLRSRADLERIRGLSTLKQWTNALVTEDRAIRTDIAHMRRRFNEGHNVANNNNNRTNTRSAPNSGTTNGTADNARSRPPQLTQEEKTLLDDHDGCYRCREFYVGHRSNACSSGYPDGTNYVPLTVARARSDATKRNVKFGSKMKIRDAGKGKTVAATTVISDGELEDVEEVTVSAISGAVDYESDSDVSPLLPERVSAPSIAWKGLVWDGDSLPSKAADCLLDCGSQLILISDSFAKSAGLVPVSLPRPIKINVAIPSLDTSSAPSALKKEKELVYNTAVPLSLSSVDHVWSSVQTFAVVVPKLVDNRDVILGLPWLMKNKIVMDYERRSAVAKGSGYDLLNPSPLAPAPRPVYKKPSTRQSVSTVRQHFRAMLRELEAVLWRRSITRTSVLENGEEFLDRKPEIIAAITSKIVSLNEEKEMETLSARIRSDYADVFGPVPRVADLPEHEFCRVHLKDPSLQLDSRAYPSPRKYREAWTRLIDEHVKAGRLVPSSSQHSSPAFLVPKADPAADPRLVVDYRKLNANVVPDVYPLPSINEIFSDCGKARFWCKFDMTNSFFQTRVHPDDRHLFAMNTPVGAFDWVVMPMGFRNAPSIHQRRMTTALRDYIRRICHIFIDDCIGWANSLAEHEANVRKILDACRANGLFLNWKKSVIVSTSVSFLGHVIDREGLHADGSKVDKVVNWPVPRSVKDVRAFLGLVRYLSAFLPALAQHTAILDPLTSNALKNNFPTWTPAYQVAFDAIKRLVVSSDCLTFIDHDSPGDNKIFVTTDASNVATGAVLAFGPTWETARPVAFDSKVLSSAERHYPVHEKEMLAVVRALKKWRAELLGMPFLIYTDHRTLQFFETQKDLSQRQARWMEFLCQYDGKIVYIKGDENSAADALSRTVFVEDSMSAQQRAHSLLGPMEDDDEFSVCLVLGGDEDHPFSAARSCSLDAAESKPASSLGSLAISSDSPSPRFRRLAAQVDDGLLASIREGYLSDPWCLRLAKVHSSLPDVRSVDGLWFIGERLVIPHVPAVRGKLFALAHDSLGHFGLRKSYGALRDSFYWPRMKDHLANLYLKSCDECQRMKDRTSRVPGPLHPLPVPASCGESIAMDFIGPLPDDEGFNCVLTITDRLGSDIRLIPCRTDSTAEEIGSLFFQHWYCENGLPTSIVLDRDRLFVSTFWKTLHRLSGIRLAMSSSFHPETDGSSERTNKSVIQAIRFHIEKNQKGWVAALPRVRFALMNTVNASTGLSPFQLRLGRSPRLVPPMVSAPGDPVDIQAAKLMESHELLVLEAQDNLLLAKINQAYHANRTRGEDPLFSVGDRVMLSTRNRRKELKAGDTARTTKFLPRWVGPYEITRTNHAASTYTLNMPTHPRLFPVFHVSQLKRYHDNDDVEVPARSLLKPGPLTFEDGTEEYFIDRILDEHKTRRGSRYLVRWEGYGEEDDLWITERELEGTDALRRWKDGLGSGS
ncbi:hypothetical protein MD484_g6573, partial [Candolleomyces efflorescens]